MAESGASRGVGVEQASLQLSLPGVPGPGGEPGQSLTVAAGYRSSPLPSPQDLAQYESVTAGAADRILKMAEKQLAHEHHYSKLILWVSKIVEVIGALIGLLICAVAIAGSFALLWVGRGAEAARVFIAGVATVATVAGVNRLTSRKSGK